MSTLDKTGTLLKPLELYGLTISPPMGTARHAAATKPEGRMDKRLTLLLLIDQSCVFGENIRLAWSYARSCWSFTYSHV